LLFHTEFDNSVIDDENKLCEKLYEFLRDYVNKRLKFENSDSKEDYVQETIMYILNRFNQLTEKEKREINLEKYFYNRANSFIGNKQRQSKKRYKILKKYLEEQTYLQEQEDQEKEIIDERLLKQIAESYKLNKDQTNILIKLSRNKLVKLGHIGEYSSIEESLREVKISPKSLVIKFGTGDPNNTLEYLSYSVVDEYLLESIKQDY
jgi:DNA-directed RNA polymerase specialized sigma24 family protein